MVDHIFLFLEEKTLFINNSNCLNFNESINVDTNVYLKNPGKKQQKNMHFIAIYSRTLMKHFRKSSILECFVEMTALLE